MRRIRTTLIVGAFLLSCVLAVPVSVSAGQARNTRGQTSAERAERRLMRFRAMDVNRDGVITRSEWRGSARAFDRHDINEDGVLSGSEIWPAGTAQGTSGQMDEPTGQAAGTAGWTPQDTAENPMVQSFARADANHDGIISRSEWQSDPTTFSRVDANGDGVITRPEYLGEGWTAETAAAPSEARRNSRAYQSGFDRGLADGRQAGKEDKELRNQWDLEGQRELEQADAGFEPSLGARPDYQAGYRAGFRIGYRQGFGPRQ